MKRENKIRQALNKTSFHSQLFLIILVSFILFEVIAYILISYTINNRYINSSLEKEIELISEFKDSINRDDESLLISLNNYKNKTGNKVLVLNTSTGGYLLDDYEHYSYTVISEKGEKYIVPSFDIELSNGDSISVSYKADDPSRTIRKIRKNGRTIYSENYTNLIQTDIVVDIIEIPKNLNYLYLSSDDVSRALSVLETSYKNFSSVTMDSTLLKQYTDEENECFYFVLLPNNLKNKANSNSLIYIISPYTETKLLSNATTVTFIVIVLISLAVAILIAIFISNAFSNPIKLFEKEMNNLKDNNYRPSQYHFKNKEMISLENTLNEVKVSISEGVDSINKQKHSLEKLNSKLVNEEELRSSFVQRLSHELKTPLMIISATTEALEAGLIEKDNEKQSYETILNEVDKTTDIIKEILNNYKNVTKKNSLVKEKFNLNELASEVIEPLIPIAKSNDLEIKTSMNDVCFMNANKEMIKNVVSNFITNAIKYTPKNNVIDVNIKENETSFVFEVINHGAHIDEKNLDKIWLPFYREKEDVDSTSTGIGLYIVKTTLESHNLEYDVCNIEGGVKSYFVINK